MLQTSYGSLIVGLDARSGQSLPVRGGTSSVGMASAALAKRLGLTVMSTTRNAGKAAALAAIGVDHVVLDDGRIASRVREIVPEGVDLALELVRTPDTSGHPRRDPTARRGVHAEMEAGTARGKIVVLTPPADTTTHLTGTQ